MHKLPGLVRFEKLVQIKGKFFNIILRKLDTFSHSVTDNVGHLIGKKGQSGQLGIGILDLAGSIPVALLFLLIGIRPVVDGALRELVVRQRLKRCTGKMQRPLAANMVIGGDDYITKPFKLAIFLSRLNALLRRSENFNTEVTELTSNDISIRLLKGEVYKQGKLLELTASEYKLLCFFMENPDQVLSAEQILGKLWDCNENYIDNNSLTVYIRRLRTKIEDNPGEPKRIVTVRGMGYKWNTVD